MSEMIKHTSVLIVGAGEAAVSMAQELRSLGYSEPVLIVGREAHLPYHRPPLSKACLSSASAEEEVWLRDAEFYEAQGIDTLLDTEVLEIDTNADQAGTARTSRGVIEFKHLVLATGARARTLQIPGVDLPGVHTLRNLDDTRRLRADLSEASQVVVIGSGFIGLETAAAVRLQGLPVTVIGVEDAVLKRVSSPPISDFLIREHKQNGIEFALEARVTELVESEGRVSGVRLADGRCIPADLVVVGIGAIPEIELASSMRIECQRGIVVNHDCQTSEPNVFAIGDCAVAPHPHEPSQLHPMESVQSAIEQGKTAARVIAGHDPVSPAIPWFWSNQGEIKMQIAGVSSGFDTYTVHHKDETGLTVLYFREERLIAADCINRPSDFMAVKRALKKHLTVCVECSTESAETLKHQLLPVSELSDHRLIHHPHTTVQPSEADLVRPY
jgi:3-phenylpropionate/trans-cinnamate dioxygenase ferredoxin reductase subunit